ncbi:hypothetical protein N7535_005775 [Penicillium sp. DV-2018c]|nr:hypothetical protein N7461_009350 [Penicillium sp. DV-2018c]KAJ5572115.1 hypothetical protein N7535_005775 [Penicillium sp. DV-2018c]
MLFLSSKKAAFVGALALSLSTGVNALWTCGADQHVFPVDTSKFLVHFTRWSDSHYDGGTPWIRICLPNDDGTWTDVEPLGLNCAPKGQTFSPKETKLKADLNVVGGSGCTGNEDAGLDGASITYKDQKINLQHGGDACGPRNHGITCQFKK